MGGGGYRTRGGSRKRTPVARRVVAALLVRIDAVLQSDMGEVRVGFIRSSIEKELERREKAALKKAGRAACRRRPALLGARWSILHSPS